MAAVSEAEDGLIQVALILVILAIFGYVIYDVLGDDVKKLLTDLQNRVTNRIFEKANDFVDAVKKKIDEIENGISYWTPTVKGGDALGFGHDAVHTGTDVGSEAPPDPDYQEAEQEQAANEALASGQE
jgi:hypothetical protein